MGFSNITSSVFVFQGEGSQVEWVGLQGLWVYLQRQECSRVYWKKVTPVFLSTHKVIVPNSLYNYMISSFSHSTLQSCSWWAKRIPNMEFVIHKCRHICGKTVCKEYSTLGGYYIIIHMYMVYEYMLQVPPRWCSDAECVAMVSR